jgi:hypothetical protein
MTAPQRLLAAPAASAASLHPVKTRSGPPASSRPVDPRSAPASASARIWERVVPIRQQWQDVGLCTEPADRPTAEHMITAIYARQGRGAPRFEWVDSPRQAVGQLDGLPTHDTLQQWIRPRRPTGRPPLASDIAAGLSRLRSALEDSDHTDAAPPAAPHRKAGKPWPALPAPDGLDNGVPLREVLRQGVRIALETSLTRGLTWRIRTALAAHGPLPVAWYGQQESSWIAYYDVLRRLGLVRFRPSDEEHLDEWATLARSCGWWWPGEDVCVIVERPAVLLTEPVSAAWHDEVRLRRASRPAVEYRDGYKPIMT